MRTTQGGSIGSIMGQTTGETVATSLGSLLSSPAMSSSSVTKPPLVFDTAKQAHYAVRCLNLDGTITNPAKQASQSSNPNQDSNNNTNLNTRVLQLSTGVLRFGWIYDEIASLRQSLPPNRQNDLMMHFFVRTKRTMDLSFQRLLRQYPEETRGITRCVIDFYPVLRLICPQADLSRRAYGLKEAKLTQVYRNVFQINRPEAIRRLTDYKQNSGTVFKANQTSLTFEIF